MYIYICICIYVHLYMCIICICVYIHDVCVMTWCSAVRKTKFSENSQEKKKHINNPQNKFPKSSSYCGFQTQSRAQKFWKNPFPEYIYSVQSLCDTLWEWSCVAGPKKAVRVVLWNQSRSRCSQQQQGHNTRLGLFWHWYRPLLTLVLASFDTSIGLFWHWYRPLLTLA